MRVAILLYLLIGAVAGAYAETPTHCSKAEKIIFSCQIRDSKKVLSLCASDNLSDSSGYLQYRYGGINKIELEYPGERKQSQKQFLYQHYFRFQVDRTEIRFTNHGHEYTIYSYYEGDGEETPLQENGVQVDNVDLQCDEPIKTDFTPLENAVPCDQDGSFAC